MKIHQQVARLAMVVFAAWLAATPVAAAETLVAVAANFTEPAREIAAGFKAATGHTATLSFGSSGQFFTQVHSGAPFEVFLSADAERPLKLEQEGLSVPKSRFTYAVGRLVLYSKTPGLVDRHGAILKSGTFAKLAIADPATAPYGAAAIETLRKLGVYDAVRPKIVQGASITQAYQFVETGAADIGFVAQSQLARKTGGSRWLVPTADHTPIDQQAVLLRAGENNPAARAFVAYLRSPAAVAIIKRFGYEVP